MSDNSGKPVQDKSGIFARASLWVKNTVNYCMEGVWSDPRNNIGTRIVKTLNLTVSSFFNSQLQNKSMALTYTTVLSIVPAFALLVAIGRGFGLQDVLQNQLYQFFPSQSKGISTALSFVDSYLKSASSGILVGVGIAMLLWTVISLLSQIEDSFNSIWSVRISRTLYQKITDYIAICLLIPVLMICSSGVSIFMSSVIQDHLNLPFLTPFVNAALELAPLLLCWVAIALSYYLIPNTKVQFKYAAIGGAIAAIGFQILQMLFLNGQIYVSKYNAIYGSFAFLPLMLIWIQLSWLLVLAGCMLTYSLQNVFIFNIMGDYSAISDRGKRDMGLIIMAVACKRFAAKQQPLTKAQIAVDYYLPVSVVTQIVERLKSANLIYYVNIGGGLIGISPATETENFTLTDFISTFDKIGKLDSIPDFKNAYRDLLNVIGPLTDLSYESFGKTLVKDLPIPTPDQIKASLLTYTQSLQSPLR